MAIVVIVVIDVSSAKRARDLEKKSLEVGNGRSHNMAISKRDTHLSLMQHVRANCRGRMGNGKKNDEECWQVGKRQQSLEILQCQGSEVLGNRPMLKEVEQFREKPARASSLKRAIACWNQRESKALREGYRMCPLTIAYTQEERRLTLMREEESREKGHVRPQTLRVQTM